MVEVMRFEMAEGRGGESCVWLVAQEAPVEVSLTCSLLLWLEAAIENLLLRAAANFLLWLFVRFS
jgi:hypothetical protein